MQQLNSQQVADLFQLVRTNLPHDRQKAILGLSRVMPSQHEISSLEWRYRFGGYTEGLYAAEILNQDVKVSVSDSLFGASASNREERKGRDFKYSVDIITEQNKTYSFDVPSMNPLDAYVQLTKRIAYKTIPGIAAVDVYAGFSDERQANAEPLKQFDHDELIFVSLESSYFQTTRKSLGISRWC